MANSMESREVWTNRQHSGIITMALERLRVRQNFKPSPHRRNAPMTDWKTQQMIKASGWLLALELLAPAPTSMPGWRADWCRCTGPADRARPAWSST